MSSANQNKTSTTGQKMESANNDKFRAELERLRLRPLWEMEVNERRTAPSEPSTHWQWNEILPLIEEAIRVAAVGAERRVLSLQNSATPNFSTALATLSGALQILLPGEHALPHRHSMNALRFVMEGSGATTRVDGKPCVMEEGDLILTPAWTWHEHVHTGTQRMVWFDCLDVPLHTYFNTTAFEPGPPASISPMRSD